MEQPKIVCPKCYCKSISTYNNDIGEIEAICCKCWNRFAPSEGLPYIEPQGRPVMIAGYCLSVTCLLILPIIFLPVSIICGCFSIGYNRIGHGILIIILALIFSFIGASHGGWGMGIQFYQ